MSETRTTGTLGVDTSARPMIRTYVAVLLVEAVVLAALWGFSRYFGL